MCKYSIARNLSSFNKHSRVQSKPGTIYAPFEGKGTEITVSDASVGHKERFLRVIYHCKSFPTASADPGNRDRSSTDREWDRRSGQARSTIHGYWQTTIPAEVAGLARKLPWRLQTSPGRRSRSRGYGWASPLYSSPYSRSQAAKPAARRAWISGSMSSHSTV